MLKRLKTQHFRNLGTLDLEFHNKLNLISGSNGSGKSSLLEAIYVNNYGKSYRTNKIQSTIQLNTQEFVLFSEHNISNHTVHLGFSKSADHGKLLLNGQNQRSFSTFSFTNPIQIIDPGSFALLERGPEERRKLIDWGVFHVEHSYLTVWKQFKNAIKQRNALLKRGKIEHSQMRFWTQQYCIYSEQVTELRLKYCITLQEILEGLLEKSPLADKKLCIVFYPGWDTKDSLESIIDRDKEKEQRYKHTLHGPHKADLKFTHQGKPAIEVLSRGQQKLLIALLKLSQLRLLEQFKNNKPILLFDDIDSELDANYLSVLLKHAYQYCDQIFLTSTSQSVLENHTKSNSAKMFHVEHGSITSTSRLE